MSRNRGRSRSRHVKLIINVTCHELKQRGGLVRFALTMSLVELRVELPAYAHSFVVLVPRTCTIAQVKQEISRTCTGGPRVDGQRIISRGRYLGDHETVEELWKVRRFEGAARIS